jgi:hypothetical protein
VSRLLPSRHKVNRNLLKRVAVAAALAAASGCASQGGDELPPYRWGSNGYGSAYPPYVSGYYGYGSAPLYSYGYPRGYDPFYYAQGMPAPYPYGYVYSPYPRYVVVPCVDSNHDGRCDRHPGKHDGDLQNDGHHHAGNGGVTPLPPPHVQPRVPPPVVHPKQGPAGGANAAQQDPPPRNRQSGRDDDARKQPRN